MQAEKHGNLASFNQEKQKVWKFDSVQKENGMWNFTWFFDGFYINPVGTRWSQTKVSFVNKKKKKHYKKKSSSSNRFFFWANSNPHSWHKCLTFDWSSEVDLVVDALTFFSHGPRNFWENFTRHLS